MTPDLPLPPQVGLIVRRNRQDLWMDDNGGDWTPLVSGPLATQSGRTPGWTLPDRDIAIIDANTLALSYAHRLLNIGMAIATHPDGGQVHLVGTEATNEIRFEPNLNGRFVRVMLASVDSADPSQTNSNDLNPHLDYSQATLPQAQRDHSIGDPRALLWQSDGQRGYIAGMGSDNVVVVDAAGKRLADLDPIPVGAGPTGLALHPNQARLFVWNHFDASLSVIDTATLSETQRVEVFNPLPAAIREGRRFFYNTQQTSGLGQASCASCHVDGRTDRLAWDLGDPSGDMQAFDQNCITDTGGAPCTDFHPMKGPMMTQTFQDIIGHEPFHWRGDRAGLEAFNGAFEALLGDDTELSATEMQAFEDFVATITFPPNPFRNLDNSLPTDVNLDGHYTTGRYGPAGQPLGSGNAQRGLDLYVSGASDDPFNCVDCHTLPTGMARNGVLFAQDLATLRAGGRIVPTGPLGQNHLGVVAIDGSTNRSIKVAQLRNMYEKVGFDTTQLENRAGFGFLHDGSVDSLARFMGLSAFELDSDQDVADLVAFMLAFSGSDLHHEARPEAGETELSQDTHAAVGQQVTVTDSNPPQLLQDLLALANGKAIDLVARGNIGWAYDSDLEQFIPSDANNSISLTQLLQGASANTPLTFTAVPTGHGPRLGLDRDGDGVEDQLELQQGSNPASAKSSTFQPQQGLYYYPDRSGHGIDLQLAGDFLFLTWFTYQDDGTSTWYQASAPYSSQTWEGDLNRFTWNKQTQFVDFETVGSIELVFDDASHFSFNWQIGERSGSEPFQPLPLSSERTLRNDTGTYFDANEPGWGVSLYSEGDIQLSVVYFYDANDQPRWVLGQAANGNPNTIELLSFTGFCPDCEHRQPTTNAGGQMSVDFSANERNASLSLLANYPELAGSNWQRDQITIIPLSQQAQDFSQW